MMFGTTPLEPDGKTPHNCSRTTPKGYDHIGLLLRLAKLVMDKAEHGDNAAQSFYREALIGGRGNV